MLRAAIFGIDYQSVVVAGIGAAAQGYAEAIGSGGSGYGEGDAVASFEARE